MEKVNLFLFIVARVRFFRFSWDDDDVLDKLKKFAVFEKKIRGLQRNLKFQYFLQHFSQTN